LPLLALILPLRVCADLCDEDESASVDVVNPAEDERDVAVEEVEEEVEEEEDVVDEEDKEALGIVEAAELDNETEDEGECDGEGDGEGDGELVELC